MYQYQCTIVKVVDGDTLDAEVDLGFRIKVQMRFRLSGINAPEMNTPEGVVSKARLTELLSIEHNLLVVNTLKDKQEKYGRYLGEFFNSLGQSINLIMVKEGQAKPYGT